MDTTRMHRLILGLLTAGTLTATTTAQVGGGLVMPPSMKGVEGTGSTNVPFGRSQPLRNQLVYDESLFAAPVSVRELRFRPDAMFASAGKRVHLTLNLGTLDGRVTDLDERFDLNPGPDYAVVFQCQEIDLPAPSAFPGGEEFPIPVPFSRSFAYDPAKGSLLMDFRVVPKHTGAYRLDSTYVCDSPMVGYGPVGCGPSGGLELESLTKNVVWGNQLMLRVSKAPPNALTILFFGNQGTGTWKGLELPWHAIAMGAPTCFLSTSILYAPRRGADALGRADFGWNVPPILRLNQAVVTVQAIAQDLTANALGVVTSQGKRLKFCGFEPVGRVFANGVDPVLGVRELGVAPIVQLR